MSQFYCPKSGDRVIVTLPFAPAQPATVLRPFRDGSLAVAIHAIPGTTFRVSEWRIAPIEDTGEYENKRPAGSAKRLNEDLKGGLHQ